MPICGIIPVDEDLADDEVVWPKPTGVREYPDVPEAIGTSANEAHLALAANAARAAVVMARAVIEATAKDKGIKSGSLESKIEQLADQGPTGNGAAATPSALPGNPLPKRRPTSRWRLSQPRSVLRPRRPARRTFRLPGPG